MSIFANFGSMITRYVSILMIIFNMTSYEAAVLPKWVHRVTSCPDPGNVSQWIEASEKLYCQNKLSANDQHQQGHQYHCLPSSFLNETVEFCGRSVPVGPGACAVYSYEVSANTQPTSYNCSKFISGCPKQLIFSKNIFEFPECLNISKRERCFKAEKNCSDSLINSSITTNYTRCNKSFTVSSSSVPSFLVYLGICMVIMIILIVIAIFRHQRKKTQGSKVSQNEMDNKMLLHNGKHPHTGKETQKARGTEKESITDTLQVDDVDERVHQTDNSSYVEKLVKHSTVCKNNSLLEELDDAMTDSDFRCIKTRLQKTNSSTAFQNISTSKELVDYLDTQYKIFHNMTFVQGLFLACKTKHLYDICLKYAKSNKDKVIYFEEEIPREGYDEVQFRFHCTESSSYTNKDVENLKTVLKNFTNAKDEDILLSGVKKGSIIVTFMIRTDLVQQIRKLFKAELCYILSKLKHTLMEVVIEEEVFYTSGYNKVQFMINCSGSSTYKKEDIEHLKKVLKNVTNAEDGDILLPRVKKRNNDVVFMIKSDILPTKHRQFRSACDKMLQHSNLRITKMFIDDEYIDNPDKWYENEDTSRVETYRISQQTSPKQEDTTKPIKEKIENQSELGTVTAVK